LSVPVVSWEVFNLKSYNPALGERMRKEARAATVLPAMIKEENRYWKLNGMSELYELALIFIQILGFNGFNLTMKCSTHRRRTKLYIKELETEVLRLRKVEADSLSRVLNLEKQVESCVKTLAANGIIAPAGLTLATHSHLAPEPGSTGDWSLDPSSMGSTSGYSSSNMGSPDAILGHGQNKSFIDYEESSGVMTSNPSLFQFSETNQPQNGFADQQFQFNDPQAEIDFVLTYVYCPCNMT
jgi:hypothetical protein